MTKHIFDIVTGKPILKVNAQPDCGEDFCDTCGDCLHCNPGDPCYPDGGSHYWVEYLESA